MEAMQIDRSIDLNLLHNKSSFLKQYKRNNVCRFEQNDNAIVIENAKDWEVKYLPEDWGTNFEILHACISLFYLYMYAI